MRVGVGRKGDKGFMRRSGEGMGPGKAWGLGTPGEWAQGSGAQSVSVPSVPFRTHPELECGGAVAGKEVVVSSHSQRTHAAAAGGAPCGGGLYE